MSTYYKEAEAAAEWWAKQVVSPVFNNGEKDAHSMTIMKMATTMIQKVTEEQSLRFRDKLAEKITERMGIKPMFSLDVDYDPCAMLAECAESAEIELTNFPIKTMMRIKPGYVEAKLSYGGYFETVYTDESIVKNY